MSLLSAIHVAKQSLNAAQIGAQVIGNNIANVDTPGYLRQQVNLTTLTPTRIGNLIVGTGVNVESITQQVDLFLEDRLRSARGELASGEAQEKAYVELEAALGELSEADLSTSLTEFFNSLQEVLNHPEDSAVRNLAVLRGGALGTDIQQVDSRVRSIRETIDQKGDQVNEANRLLSEVSRLNKRIVATELGGALGSDAVGLRDTRLQALSDLAQVLDVRVEEQANGAVNVFASGDFLVFDGTLRTLTTRNVNDHDQAIAEVLISGSNAPVPTSSGEIAGLIAARDEILGNFLDRLDGVSQTLIEEFNALHSAGQGLRGLTEATGQFAVDDTTVALDGAGLAASLKNGSFQVLVRDEQTGLTDTHDIFVQLNGTESGTSLDDLVAALDALEGIRADVSPLQELEIKVESRNVTFGFANDSSGALGALGINAFFRGSGASDIAVTSAVRNDPGLLATSAGGIGADSVNASRLAGLLTSELRSQPGATLSGLYENLVGDVAHSSALTKSVANGFRTFHQTLESEKLALSGVNLDEEAVNLITYQRHFQASARVIAAIDEMLQILVNL